MNVTLYIEYQNNDLSFETDKVYDNDEYAKALNESYNQTKDAVFESMYKGDLKASNKDFNTFNIFNNKVAQTAEKQYYTTCQADLLDENMQDETEMGLVNKFESNDGFVNYIILNFDTSEEDFETEFKMWVKETKKIDSLNTNDDWKFNNLPQKDVRIKFKSVNGIDGFALLQNCKIIDYSNNAKYALLVERISFIKNID